MKFLKNKSMFKKIVIVMLVILVVVFCFSGKVKAAKDDGVGGKLLNPIVDLLVFLGDGTMNVVQGVIFGNYETTIPIDLMNDFLEVFLTALVIIIIAAAAIFTLVVGGAAIVAAAAKIGVTIASIKVGTVLLVTVGATTVGTALFRSNVLPDNLHLPVYQISPEQIFLNDVGLFDVDFFNPNKEEDNPIELERRQWVWGPTDSILEVVGNIPGNIDYDKLQWKIISNKDKIEESKSVIENEGLKYEIIRKIDRRFEEAEGVKTTYEVYKIGVVRNNTSIAYELRSVISNWYNVLRDIAVVALLSILVYVGIRIVISSTANDKSKYKQMLMDWIVAICLLFFMQYIMAFSNIVVKKVIDVVDDFSSNSAYVAAIADKDGKISKALKKLGYEDVKMIGNGIDGEDYIQWDTNLMGIARINAQMAKKENTSYAGYALIFIVLVLYTCYFVFTYLRRVLYMAFLTIIAPLVAMTYPIDKINDGKAQAFNMWFKEYIFNLLIQPMHLILYTILISSAFELAATNIIYSLVAIGFMIPAEKLVRKFFGFEKAQTPGFLGGAAGAAMTMTAMNKLLSGGGSKGKSGNGGSKSSSKDGNDSGKPPYTDPKFDRQGAMLDLDGGSDGSDSTQPNSAGRQVGMLPGPSDGNFGGTGDPAENDPNIIDLNDDEWSMSDVDDNSIPRLTDDDVDVLPPDYHYGDDFMPPAVISDDYEDEFMPPAVISDDDNSLEVQDEIPQNDTPGEKKKGLKDRLGESALWREYSTAARYYGKGLKDKAIKRIENADPARAALRTIGGVATGLAAGGLGLAAGIASGDPSKALQYGGGALLGGYKVGSSGVSKMADALHVDGIDEIQERAKYGSEEEYKKAKQKEYIEKYKKNTQNQYELEKVFGRKGAQVMMDKVVTQCLDNGVHDMKDIITIGKMIQKDGKDISEININENDIKRGIATAKYASMVGSDPKKMTDKKYKEWHETFAHSWEKNDKLKQMKGDPKKQATKDMDKIHEFYKIRSQL